MSILQFIKDHFTQTDHSHLVAQDGQSILSNWEIGGHHVQVVFYVQNNEFLMIRVGDLYKFPQNSPVYRAVLDEINSCNKNYRFTKAMCDPDNGEVVVSGEAWFVNEVPNASTFDHLYDAVMTASMDLLKVIDKLLNENDSRKLAC